jgi:hypothetical protein
MRVVMAALILLLILVLVLVGSPAWRGLRCRRSVLLPRVLHRWRPRTLTIVPIAIWLPVAARHRPCRACAPGERAVADVGHPAASPSPAMPAGAPAVCRKGSPTPGSIAREPRCAVAQRLRRVRRSHCSSGSVLWAA